MPYMLIVHEWFVLRSLVGMRVMLKEHCQEYGREELDSMI